MPGCEAYPDETHGLPELCHSLHKHSAKILNLKPGNSELFLRRASSVRAISVQMHERLESTDIILLPYL
jgi:hypothetical protein